jgi:hypothetical protein
MALHSERIGNFSVNGMEVVPLEREKPLEGIGTLCWGKIVWVVLRICCRDL